MLGRPEWFTRRKYGGWGVKPTSWQGYMYIAFLILPFVFFQAVPSVNQDLRIQVTIVWLTILVTDVGRIMVNLPLSNKERQIEAYAERNALWAVIGVLVFGVLFQLLTSVLDQNMKVDWFIVGALGAGALVKSISNFILDRKR
ncbi:MAG: hypothetical protein ABIJ03_00565 [Patescibacteria group bacterium]|nr:hypothetical protein [Patescibacteria group bacterium]